LVEVFEDCIGSDSTAEVDAGDGARVSAATWVEFSAGPWVGAAVHVVFG
jgi:hypothetical protein